MGPLHRGHPTIHGVGPVCGRGRSRVRGRHRAGPGASSPGPGQAPYLRERDSRPNHRDLGRPERPHTCRVEAVREDTGLVSRLPALALPARAGRRTNVGLLGLLVVAAATGVLAYGVGTAGAARGVTAVHGAAGLGLLLLAPWKSVIVRRALRRGLSAVAAGLGLLVALTVVTGVLHAAGVTGSVAGVSVLAVHVGAGVCVLPLLVGHAWGRRQRPRRTDLSRRVLLQSGGLALGAAAVWTAGETLWRVTGVPGARRRATGSLEQGTDEPAAMPVTQWFTDTVPDSVPSALLLTDGAHPLRVPMSELTSGDGVRATL